MAYPDSIDTFTTIGTGNTMDESGFSHRARHNDIQTLAESIEGVLGTTAGTSVLRNAAVGDFTVMSNSGGTVQQALEYPNGTITGGTVSTTEIAGGTIHNPTIGTPALTDGTVIMGGTMSAIFDEDDMASDSNVGVPTQQSVVSYISTNSGVANTDYKFRYRGISGTLSLGAGTWTVVPFATADYDPGSDYSGGTYTAPVNGVYLFNAATQFNVAAQSDNCQINIDRNGTAQVVRSYVAFSAGGQYAQIEAQLSLSAGDTVLIEVLNNSNADTLISSGQYTWFEGHILSI